MNRKSKRTYKQETRTYSVQGEWCDKNYVRNHPFRYKNKEAITNMERQPNNQNYPQLSRSQKLNFAVLIDPRTNQVVNKNNTEK